MIADEVTDLLNKELLAMVLRYVDHETDLPREGAFLECDTGISGHCLAEKIITALTSYDLDLTKLRGQGYDGVGNMAGLIRGTAALISACTISFGFVSTLCITFTESCSGQITSNYE